MGQRNFKIILLVQGVTLAFLCLLVGWWGHFIFNQADEIAKCWAAALDIKIDRNALRRTRHTLSQSGLSAAQRERNLHSAFSYSSKKRYRHVAIVDDIVTTGSTVQEISKLLHRAGIEYVEVWALARTYQR